MHHSLPPLQRLLVAIALVIVASFGLIVSAKAAGTRSAGINVGITIGGPSPTTARYTCGAATTLIGLAGFTNVSPQICTGDLYLFSALQGAQPSIIQFDATTGNIAEVSPVN